MLIPNMLYFFSKKKFGPSRPPPARPPCGPACPCIFGFFPETKSRKIVNCRVQVSIRPWLSVKVAKQYLQDRSVRIQESHEYYKRAEGPSRDEHRPPAAAHSKFQSSSVLKHVNTQRDCETSMHAKETTEGGGAAQLHESSRAAEAACTSRNSLPSQCSKCEKQTATAVCEVYTSCTVTKQAPSSLHCSQARLCIVAKRGRDRRGILRCCGKKDMLFA